MPDDFVARLLAYFDELAPSYAADIEPAFHPLVEELVDAAALRPTDQVLDLGTGTGLAARLAAPRCALVAAVDFSYRMVHAARALGVAHTLQGDMHHLPLRTAEFDVVLAALAFNSTDPEVSMPEAYRVLRPGGRLALQEWGTTDELSELLEETLNAYAVEEPAPGLAARRVARFAYHPWDELVTSDDIVDLLHVAGFIEVTVNIVTADVLFEDVRDFIRYKLAWPFRRAELAAMAGDVRRLCLSDLQENLGAHAGRDGHLTWQPNLVRVLARKPR